MAIKWTPDLSVGVKEIDAQHQAFVGMLNELYDSFVVPDYKEKTGIILPRLVDYALLHFATEEKYFDLFKYEGTEEHVKEHRDLQAKVEAFMRRYQSGENEIILELIDFMEDWLVHHLQNLDMKYVKCFHDHGLY